MTVIKGETMECTAGKSLFKTNDHKMYNVYWTLIPVLITSNTKTNSNNTENQYNKISETSDYISYNLS